MGCCSLAIPGHIECKLSGALVTYSKELPPGNRQCHITYGDDMKLMRHVDMTWQLRSFECCTPSVQSAPACVHYISNSFTNKCCTTMTTETFYSLTNQHHQCVIIFFSLEGLNDLIICPDQKIELKDFKAALIEKRF